MIYNVIIRTIGQNYHITAVINGPFTQLFSLEKICSDSFSLEIKWLHPILSLLLVLHDPHGLENFYYPRKLPCTAEVEIISSFTASH